MRYIVNFKDIEMEQFYKYEGKLATYPIIEFIDKHGDRFHGKLIDIGSGNKPYMNYFRHVEYIGVDIANEGADIIANAKLLPIESDSIDVVLCNQLIEHDPEPHKIVAEIHRILKEGGALILSAPQMGRLHGEPNDYYRYTKWGLKCLLERNGMKIEIIESHGGIFRALGSHLNLFIIDYLGRSKYVKSILRYIFVNMNNFSFGFLDYLIVWKKDTLGYNIIATKVQ
jgi:SAM-dependent methyltransferase